MMTEYSKKQIALRYWLQGVGYFKSLEAMEFAKGFHKGVRKDGKTPEFDHQLSIALYARTILPWLEQPENTITTILLHDVREDYDVSEEEIVNRFGDEVSHSVQCMTKVFRGVKKSNDLVFDQIANDACASIAKGCDRIHNQGSMVGVFNIAKQKEYIEEGEKYILPMLKVARRRFIRQEGAYENIKMMLLSQMSLIKEIHNTWEKH